MCGGRNRTLIIAFLLAFATQLSGQASIPKDLQRVAEDLATARGTEPMDDPTYQRIVAGLLAWLDARMGAGATEEVMNGELEKSGVFSPPIAADDRPDDINHPFEGYLAPLSVAPVPGADDLVAVHLEIGLTCAFDDVAVIYRRSPVKRLGWLSSSESTHFVAWGFNSIEAGATGPDGKRFLVVPASHLWCTSTFGSGILRIEEIRDDGLHTILRREVGLRRWRSPVVRATVMGDTATFEYEARAADTNFLTRDGIERYQISSGLARRVPPFALSPMAFVSEWLELDDILLPQVSSAEAARAHKAAVEWSKDPDKQHGLLEFDGGRFCPGSPNTWEIDVGRRVRNEKNEVHPGEPRTFVLSESGAASLKMLSVETHPVRNCRDVGTEELNKNLQQ